MDIEWRSVSDLQPYPQNAKKHDERQIRNVATSIERFGWRQPLVVDKNDVVVIGHCRLLAAKELGLDKVPVTVADDLTEEEIRELRIVDNKTNESPWDFELLQEDAKELIFEGFNFEGLTEWSDYVSAGDYSEEFSLPSGDKEPFVQMTFTLANEQAELIKSALQQVRRSITETFGNDNSNGNALYEVVREWAAQRR